MIDPLWRRISGIHVQDEGKIGAVWLAHDKDSDCIHLYDACVFKLEVLAVIAEGLNARGRWIPISWDKGAEDISQKLLERGCSMMPEPVKDSQSVAEVISRDIWERMRTNRFKVDKRLKEWTDEFESFYRDEAKIPFGVHPLMSATRYAVENIAFARRQQHKKNQRKNALRLAII